MNRFLKKKVSAFLAFAMASTLFSSLALAAGGNPPPILQIPAATVTLNNLSANKFVIQVPGQTTSITQAYHVDTTGAAQVAVTEQVRDSSDQVVYEWNNYQPVNRITGDYHITWNGTYLFESGNKSALDHQPVPNGSYKFYFKAQKANAPDTIVQSAPFQVVNYAPVKLALISVPVSYVSGSGATYTLNYNLDLGTSDSVDLSFVVSNGNGHATMSKTDSVSGASSVSWNGQIGGAAATPGNYTYSLAGTEKPSGIKTNNINGNFVISATPISLVAVSFSNLSVNQNPYNPQNGSLNLKFDVNNMTNATIVSAAIYNSNDVNNAVKTWSISPVSNHNTFNWDGRNNGGSVVGNGNYIFRVSGHDGASTTIPSQEVAFQVVNSATDPVQPTPPIQGNLCAGFTDIANNSSDCAAITYVKNIGAMTGNPDGTFNATGLLQRDQISKIILETFVLFDKKVDYCQSFKPFVDMDSTRWSYQYVCRGKALGMITGYLSGIDAGKYRPDRPVNRVEFLALVLRNVKDNMPTQSAVSYQDVATGQWFSGYASYAKSYGLFDGSYLYPTNFMSRVEVARVLLKLHNLAKF